jgi:uncharacterized protein YbaA (DUF1428 family)
LSAPYALSKYTTEQALAVGCVGNTASISGGATARVCVTDTTKGLSGGLRTGFITTQFMESKNLTDMWNSIAVKYRKMIDPDAVLEVKYRTWKNIDCNTTITWTSATTFTCATADLAGTGAYYNTQAVVGDEVFVQYGNNCGLIAHVTTLVVAGATTTVTIDRDATTTSGTAYAQFSNYTLLGSIDINNPEGTFKNFRLAKKSTMVQIKVVMKWKGYYDEVQEILLSEQKQDSTI